MPKLPEIENMFRMDLLKFYSLSPTDRIAVIRQGVPPAEVSDLAARMDMPTSALLDCLGISAASFNRKARANLPLTSYESELVLGIVTLIGEVEAMVASSGDVEGFDAAQWLGRWLRCPVPALGGRLPADYLDTIEGQKLVSRLLAACQSGAYM